MRDPNPLLPDLDYATIERLGATCAKCLAGTWHATRESHAQRPDSAFAKGGDKAYGTNLTLLLRPLTKAMRTFDLGVYPRLPGSFMESREWGNADGSEQQRWFWTSIVRQRDVCALGTLVTVLHHDHRCFRLPRAPEMFALAAVGVDVVERELCSLSAGYAAATPFRLLHARTRTVPDGEETT